MNKKLLIVICLHLLAGLGLLNAQKPLKKAEILSQNSEFDKAAEVYNEYLKENPAEVSVMAQMAEAYTKAGDLVSADKWYKKLGSEKEVEPMVYKKHGDVLKKMGNYDEAITQYKRYSVANPVTGASLISGCEFAKRNTNQSPQYEVLILPSNSSASDFGLTFYKGMPVFSSFREDILMTETERELLGDSDGHRSYIYNHTKNRLLFVKGPNEKLNHIGPLSFSMDGRKCALIESKAQDANSFVLYPKSAKLLIADINDIGEMTSFKPFAYNEVGSTINSAHMAFNGTAIYFSSDRSGGYGGYDIYVSYLIDNEWSLPENLGPTINTAYNEITPFLHENKLYFSSDFYAGLGGFDIMVSETQNGVWMFPQNPGSGINSPGDEFFPYVNSQNELYITSDRLGGKGKFDIYKAFKLQNSTEPMEELAIVPPPAVNLDQLAAQTQSPSQAMNEATPVSDMGMSQQVAFKLPDFDATKVGSNSTEELSLTGAYRVALQEFIPNMEVYFIQLASMSSTKPNFDKFRSLLKYGNIYKMFNNKTIKVRLGYYNDKKEAEDILAKVKTVGYKDAFISMEVLNTAQMELVLTSTDEKSFTDYGNNNNTKNTEVAKSIKTVNKYKVRLASYEDPIWFEVNKVKDLGRIEQWTKGGWTIFILAGYNSLEEAKAAQIQAYNRGYKTAEVVIDNGGILERLKQN